MGNLAPALEFGRRLVCRGLPAEEYAKALADQGVPKPFADLLVETRLSIARGDWYTESTNMRQLLGRPG
ncbi:hypothetical protein E0500_041450 [Streptomyces sp. KM273126]|uniref:hypothetical protein n=1 Tax=Streptomyces sp. KM273126 TaxID=2545247 RepID=UPI00103F147D|nr:hypothetical protein [Streptomyces sp. KM273126]MBA2813618.1 hypothetical protein [Streptomyces sp. KM273126]